MSGRRSILLTLSMVANVALATWCATRIMPPSSTVTPPETVAAPVEEDVILEPIPEPLPQPRYTWSWKEVWKKNATIEELTARLRELDCPDYVVSVVLEYKVNELFANREQKLRTVEDYWITADAQEALLLKRRRALWLLLAEKRALISEATGVDWALRESFKVNEEITQGIAGEVYFFGHVERERAKQAMAATFRAITYLGELRQCYRETEEHEIFKTEQRAALENYTSELAAVLTREEIDAFDRHVFRIDLFDVWDEDRYFGAAPEPQVLQEALRILTPTDYAAYTLMKLDPFRNLTWRGLKQRNRKLSRLLGKKTYGHFRDFTEKRSSSKVPWKPAN